MWVRVCVFGTAAFLQKRNSTHVLFLVKVTIFSTRLTFEKICKMTRRIKTFVTDDLRARATSPTVTKQLFEEFSYLKEDI